MISINKIGWLVVIWATVITPVLAQDSSCTVAGIAILPGNWENSGTKISLKVQSQDSSGSSCNTNETIYLTFPNSRADQITGESGGKLQAWISATKANRYFYYHSDSLNTDQITVIATTNSDKSWQATVAIADIITGNNATSDDDLNQVKTENSDDYLVLSTQTEEKTFSAKSNWRIGAGSDRLVLVGSRVNFKVEDNAGDNQRTIYSWSFGDGAAKRGAVAGHTYNYPGVYQVVVTAKDSLGREAAARLKVKVIAPTVAVGFVGQTGSVKVSNKNGEEINLGQFRLVASDQPAFIFPPDTIIGIGQTIIVDQSISGLEFSPTLSLLDPTGRLVAESNLATKRGSDLAAQLVSLQARLLSAQNQLAAASVKSTAITTAETSPALINNQEPSLTEQVVTLGKPSVSPLKRLLNFFKMK